MASTNKTGSMGLLHPGAMGASVGAAAMMAGTPVRWVSDGRSVDTKMRASNAGFEDCGTLEALVEACEMVISVCPPHAALDLARTVARTGFKGTYVDANAIAPTTAREICAVIEHAGGQCVDGGIIGPPAHAAGTTRLYLSGDRCAEVAQLFSGSALEAVAIDGDPGAASAVKMCYAAWTKGSDALLLAIRALARAEGVDASLLAEWELSQPSLAARSASAADRNAPKAWRFVGEMNEIAASFRARSLPNGFHLAAAEVYARLAGFKDEAEAPDLDAVLCELIHKSNR